MLKPLIILSLLITLNGNSQSLALDSDIKDVLGSNTVSYSISGSVNLDPTYKFKLELLEIGSDALNTIYSMESTFDKGFNPTNNTLKYDAATGRFSISCGEFSSPDLMVHISIMKDSELIEEIYHQ